MVVEDEDLVIGWACLSPYSDREGYQYTVTDSIYIRKEFRRQRIGYELLSVLVGGGSKAGLSLHCSFYCPGKPGQYQTS